MSEPNAQTPISATVPSATVPAATLPQPAADHAGPPSPERRQLITILAVIEGLLMLAPVVFGSYIWAQPVPVDDGPGGGCLQGGGVASGASDGVTHVVACGSTPTSQALALLSVFAVLAALLVLPVLIGLLSRRWQTAVAAPSIPVWVLTVLAAVLTVFARYGASAGYASINPIDGYNPIFSLVFSTPLILMVLIAGALGGLAWLAQRGFAR